ncbi:MAG: M1 family aminopeptidase [Bacteroidales bacterium]
MKKWWITGIIVGLCFAAQAQGLKSDTIDVVHYDLHLDIMNFSAKNLNGFAVLTLTPKMNQITHIPLDLLALTVDSVKVNGQIIPAWYRDDKLLRIPLQAPASVGDTLRVRIRYRGTPVVEPAGWGGFHFNSWIAYNLGVAFQADPHNYGRAWFPCVDDFIDRATYDYYITTEPDKKAVCGGLLVGSTTNPNNTITWHWRMNQTLPAYLASVAVANYEEFSHIYIGLAGQVPVSLFFRPGDSAAVNALFTNLDAILAVYENHWGPYSFDRVGYVGTIEGAMEHAANIAYPVSSLNASSEWLYVHELAHMWFGDKVTCSSAEDMWLNEGWAVFNESLYREGLYGYNAYRTNMNQKLASVLRLCHIKDQGYLALYGIPNAYTYGETVYQKGGVVVHTLRNYLGDSLFFPSMQAFLNAFAFQPASSFQLRDFLSTHTGVDLTAFFEGWVFSPGFPGFVIDSMQVTPVGNEFQVRVFVHQKSKGPAPIFNANRLFLGFLDNNWHITEKVMEFSGEYADATFILPFSPLLCLADPFDRIADATTDLQKVIKTPGDYDFDNTYFRLSVDQLSDSVFVRVTHNWTAPDSLKIPTPGLRLSDYRYWRIDVAGSMPQSTGRFYYSRPGYLDQTLLQNLNDSLVILYRPNAAADWQGVPFTRTGSLTGYIYVNNLQPGEYALAAWDQAFVGLSERGKSNRDFLHIYPNPVGNIITIEVKPELTSGRIEILDLRGRILYSFHLSDNTRLYQWNSSALKSGLYYARWIDAKGKIQAVSAFSKR